MSMLDGLTRYVDETRKLKRIVNQQKASLDDLLKKYLKQKDKLRDAEAYIMVLEHENELFQQQISDLQNEEVNRESP